MSTTVQRRNGGYFTIPNRWSDAGYLAAAPGSVTKVYLHLSRWADNGTLESSQPMRLIAKKCGLTEKVARRAVRVLEAWGVLERDPESGVNAHNTWTLNDLPDKAPPYPGAPDEHQNKSGHEESARAESARAENGTPYQPNGDQPNGDQPERDITEGHPKTDAKDKTDGPDYSDDFLAFYAAYPNKKAKGNAWAAWRKLNPSPDLQRRMLAAVEQQKASTDWQKENGKYIPHPATWINQARWDDEPTQPPPTRPKEWRLSSRGVFVEVQP